MSMALVTAFYGCLALLALWATKQDFSRRHIAYAIAFTWVVSNVLFYIAPFSARPTIQPVFDIFIGLTALAGWEYRRGYDVVVLVALATLSACASLAHSLAQTGAYAWELTTNIIFILECVAVSARGVYYAAVHPQHASRRRAWSDVKLFNPLAWIKRAK